MHQDSRQKGLQMGTGTPCLLPGNAQQYSRPKTPKQSRVVWAPTNHQVDQDLSKAWGSLHSLFSTVFLCHSIVEAMAYTDGFQSPTDSHKNPIWA